MARQKDPTVGAVNAEELGRIFGVSRRAIYKWADQGLPRQGRLFDVAECVQWQLNRLSERHPEEPKDILDARRRLYIAQEAKTRLEADRLRGDLIDRDEAVSVLFEVASVVASTLDGVAPRIAAEVIGIEDQKEVQTILFREHRILREHISSQVGRLAAASRGDNQTTAGSDSGHLGGSESDIAAGES